MEKKVSHYSFIVGVIIAVVLGLAVPIGDSITAVLTSLLVVLGLIVGFMNVTGKETQDYLMVATVLVIVSFAGSASGTLGGVMYVGQYLEGVFKAIMAFVVPATVVVGLKSIMAMSKTK
ncbi:MAG: hypothetical protein ABIC04_08150 [Nanoarchaeota archaeon]